MYGSKSLVDSKSHEGRRGDLVHCTPPPSQSSAPTLTSQAKNPLVANLAESRVLVHDVPLADGIVAFREALSLSTSFGLLHLG